MLLLHRYVLQERLRLLFPPGSRVIDLGGGTGEDALFLAGRGVKVLGPVAAAAASAVCDGAYSTSGLPDHVFGRELASRLRAGAPILLSFPGPWPLPATLARALKGTERSPARGLRPGDVRAAFGGGFEWQRAYALGVLVPSDGRWAGQNPQAFGLLAALERAVRGWPVLRSLGESLVLEGRARPRR